MSEVLVALEEIGVADKPVLERLFQYYLYDMSEFAGWPVCDDGRFAYPDGLLSPYWDMSDHHPYFVVSAGEIAGFALVRRTANDDGIWDMGQFFILRKFRGMGAGRAAFVAALRRHPGRWQVRVLTKNRPAHGFWKACIGDIPGGGYSEKVGKYDGHDMTFLTFQSMA